MRHRRGRDRMVVQGEEYNIMW